MSKFESKSLCILGRQPTLGLAELESLYGANHLKPLAGATLLDIDINSIQFKRLGGTLKLARVLNILPTTKWSEVLTYLKENIPKHIQHIEDGTFTLGLSIYNLSVPVSLLNKNLLEIKKIIRATGRSVRVVPNKELTLNSAQVLHNRLTSKGAWELLVVRHAQQTILAQTMFVQDIEAYGARDQVRPKRDARIGMLPPKLAQIIINLAKPPPGKPILDPFCGTGVLLQEALLIGYEVLGSDIEPRMVEYSKANLDWLKSRFELLNPSYHIEQGDATTHQWSKNIGAVVSEVYLGRPLLIIPPADKLNRIIQDVNTIVKKFLHNLAGQLASGTSVSLAMPAWRHGSRFIHLPVIDHLTELGYNRVDFKNTRAEDLIYFRENQTVARQLIVLTKI